MAKKKKKYLIKLNNKIRNYFDGLPFDEGVATLDDEKLMELVMLLELDLPSHERDEMIRAIRRVWSEEGAGTREMIVSYLTERYKAVPKGKREAPDSDKVGKILSILSHFEHDKHEENMILDAFIDMKHSKITPEKIANKLHYLRLKERLGRLEKKLGVEFTTLNEMQFTHSFTFSLEKYDFNKLLLCTTEPLPLDELWELPDEVILQRLTQIKEETIETRNEEIEAFLDHLLHTKHPYLDEEEMSEALKHMPIESPLYHAPIKFSIIENILKNISDKYEVYESCSEDLGLHALF